MIQQRMAELLRSQNWVSVGIEFILIIVGVLIALEVNNWNEQRQELQLEREYIGRLINDLDADVIQFENIQRAAKRRLDSGLKLRQAIASGELANEDLKAILRMIRETGFTARPHISNYTFDALKSSGNLHLIQSAQIQSKLLSYYSYLTNRRQYDYIIEANQLKYQDAIKGILTMEQQDRFFARQDETVTTEDGQRLFKQILNNTDFHLVLPGAIANQRNFERNARTGESLARALIEDLNRHLDRDGR